MQIKKFITELPEHYDNFFNPTVFTKPEYDFLAETSFPGGATTKFIGHLLNFAISLLEPNEAHLHIGVYRGRSLAYAMSGQLDKIHYVNDNFSHEPNLQETFISWMNTHGYLPHMHLYVGDCFQLLESSFIKHKIGVYFYDAGHSFAEQLKALRLIEPLLANQAIIIIDDTNWEEPRKANQQWISENPHAFMVYDLPTVGNCSPTWWNGIQILGYDRS